MSDDDEIKTHFKGPGQWRSQVKKLEEEAEEVPQTVEPVVE